MFRMCIVGGCGHVGLPLGMMFAQNGLQVTLFDLNEERVREVSDGKMPFLERGAEELLPTLLANGRLHVSASPSVVSEQDIVVITIGTPVDEYLDPGVNEFDQAIDQILDKMVAGQLLILRSTVFPAMTDRLARRVANRGLDIDIAYCPERIVQGFALDELSQHPQIISGITPAATKRVQQLFHQCGIKTLVLSAVEAELAKLFANAYRYISFAIANQFYTIADSFNADFGRIHDVLTTDYPRMNGFPKAGFAAGPCLLKDTMQLAAFNHNSFVLGQAAMMVNEGFTKTIVDIAKRSHDLSQCKAAILGMAFKGNSDDSRDSLAYKLRKLLKLECRDVVCTDPYIKDASFVSLESALEQADIFFVGACHDEYKNLQLDKPIFDVFGFLQPDQNQTNQSIRNAA